MDSTMTTPRFKAGYTAVLVIDIQEKLVPHMHNPLDVVAQSGKLIDGANALKVPVLVTEQYRKGLGQTVPELAAKLTGAVCNHEKLRFSGCIDPIKQELAKLGVRSVIVCGTEAHVCVLQTAIDLCDLGYITGVALDAIGSRKKADQDAAVMRMTQAGVLPTTVESALLEIVQEAGTPAFKAILPIIR
jgi:nicotinamidase-related amidase